MDGASLKTTIKSITDFKVLEHHQVKVIVEKDINADFLQMKFCSVSTKKCAPEKK